MFLTSFRSTPLVAANRLKDGQAFSAQYFQVLFVLSLDCVRIYLQMDWITAFKRLTETEMSWGKRLELCKWWNEDPEPVVPAVKHGDVSMYGY